MKRIAISCFAASTFASSAYAQQWSALDRVPRPYHIVAVDSSMSMDGAPLVQAKQILVGTTPGNEEASAMYLFRDQFAFGGYSYSGAIFAHIKDGTQSIPNPWFRAGMNDNTVVTPSWSNLSGSYASTRAMIRGLRADHCYQNTKNSSYHCGEQILPGGVVGAQCITPNCTAETDFIEHLTQNPMPGLVIPNLPQPAGFPGSFPPGWPAFTFPCDNLDPTGYPDNLLPPAALPPGCPDATNPACPAVNVPYELSHELVTGGFNWPRFYDLSNIDDNVIESDICIHLRNAYTKINQKLVACQLSPPALNPPLNCNANALKNSICSGSSPFLGGTITPIGDPPRTIGPTCVCDPNQPGCSSGGGNDACGFPLRMPARQQVGVCRSHDVVREPAATVMSAPGNDNAFQDPNRHSASAAPETFCRSSVVTFVTDGGGIGGGLVSAHPRNADFYFDDVNAAQNNVVTVGSLSAGNAIQTMIRGTASVSINGLGGSAVGAIRNRMARDLNRSLKGTYAASAPALSQYQDRAAFMVMEVPGFASSTHLDYFGRPVRLEWWSINPTTGVPIARLFSTDEASRAGAGIALNPMRTYLGPLGNWSNGTPKFLSIAPNTLDRNGNGTADAHPAVQWGFHLGGEGSKPVIVGAPTDVPEGSNRRDAAAWQQSVYARPRVAYALSNGYLHAYNVGFANPAATPGATVGNVGDIQVGIDYDDNPARSGVGSEIFRFRPDFIEDIGGAVLPRNFSTTLIDGQPRYMYNDLLQQPIIERGQLFVRDVQLTKTPPYQFATVLVMTQGNGGRGIAALNVSSPGAPVVLWDEPKLDPGARALAAPTIYMWPDPAGGDAIPAVVVVGKWNSGSRMYAYRVRDGVLISSVNLPHNPTRNWPNTPVCVDREGAGRVDRCFALRDDGLLAATVISGSSGGFGAAANITPSAPSPIGGGRIFASGLTAYFTGNNDVALVFGSGDPTKLERRTVPAQQNEVFKAVFKGSGGLTPATLANVCKPNATLLDGRFVLPAGEMLVSPPTVAKGTVAFATYLPAASGCLEGESFLYAFDFETCRDAIPNGLSPPPTAKPTGHQAGAGLPGSPVVMRRAGKIVVQTTATIGPPQTIDVRTRGRGLEAIRPVFFRVRSSSK